MRLLQPVYCLFGKHHRSRGRAWTDGVTYRSWCDGCGKPMIRDKDSWSIDPNPVPAAKQD